MNDRELLELAAKAAGLSNPEWAETVAGAWAIYHDYPSGGQVHWNPLSDDGDALRLAVKLKIGILQLSGGVDTVLPDGRIIEGAGYDLFDVTRRVIVIAAAEIGRNMQ